MFHQFRREEKVTQELAEEAIVFSTNHGFSLIVAWTMIFQGWALAEQGQREAGIAQMRSALATFRASGAGVGLPLYLSLLAEAHGKAEQPAEGLSVLGKALAVTHHTGERPFEPELYRVKGELLLTQEGSRLQDVGFREKTEEAKGGLRLQAIGHREKTEEAEECFLKVIEIAQRLQAKSLELRAATSLARLWQSQGKQHEARNLLSEIYHWFTEGFDTKDLQEAKALLDELSRGGW
jgi:predicted ATPase